MKNPQLRRDIQPVPFMAEGRRMVSFNDPLRLARAGVALDGRAIPLLMLLDGTRDLRGIQVQLARLNHGAIIPMAELEAFVAALDESGLLESESFLARKQAVRDEFERLSERGHCLAGRSYPAEPEAITAGIRQAEERLGPVDGEIASGRVRGILAPHIDISVAHDTYVGAYRCLAGREYDLVIILGINHNGSGGLWSISDKDYATPVGTLKAHRELIAGLKERIPEGALAPDDFDHKHEHSVEFQAVFLRHYLGEGARIVPILCGGIHEFVSSGQSPLADRRFLAMRQALHEIMERGGRTLLVAGVDFSHVGLKFGHDQPADLLLPGARAGDERILQSLREGSPEGIFAQATATRDFCNVCGLPAMLLFSWLLGPCPSKLLGHGTYDEQTTRSAVTYASMVFFK